MNGLDAWLAKLTEKKRQLDALRPLSPAVLAKLLETLRVEWRTGRIITVPWTPPTRTLRNHLFDL